MQENHLAYGTPNSDARQEQVEFIWRKNLPDLHVHIPRTQRAEWFSWALGLNERTSYWCSALARVNPKGKLVKQFAPQGSDETDINVIAAAYNDAAQRLRTGWKDPETHFSSEKQRARVLGKHVEVLENIDGSEVSVWASGKVHFLWKESETSTLSFSIGGSRHLVPRDTTEKRFINFTHEGIAIVDKDGDCILRRDQSDDDMVTWTTKQLSLLPEREELKRCWEYHVPDGTWDEQVDIAELDETAYSIPASFFEPKGSPPLRQKQKSQGYSRPPNPGDGTWIMNEFLNEYLDDVEGGRLFNGKLEDFPERESENLRKLLGDFIRLDKFVAYPWREDWLAWIDTSTSSATSNIRENVKFCRDVTNKSANKSSGRTTSDGKPINLTGTWWYIGARKPDW